jgi:hypothetical protein
LNFCELKIYACCEEKALFLICCRNNPLPGVQALESVSMAVSQTSCHWPCFVTSTSVPYLVLVRIQTKSKRKMRWYLLTYSEQLYRKNWGLGSPDKSEWTQEKVTLLYKQFLYINVTWKAVRLRIYSVGFAWKTSPSTVVPWAIDVVALNCLFNLGLSFLELYAFKIVLCS